MTVITGTSHPSLTLPPAGDRPGRKVTVQTSRPAMLTVADGEELNGVRNGSLSLDPNAGLELWSYVILDEKKPGVVIGGGWRLSP